MSVTINNLPNGTNLTGNEVLPLVQNNTTIKATANDVANLAKPYKVFTALLTQSGGSSVVGIYNGGDYPIVVGATYTIIDNGGYGWDFTNIGAPNNNIGTSFVATGTVPNSWGVDGLMEQNLGAPVATVLENTIGNIWFTYNGVGSYFFNSNNLFTAYKSTILVGNVTWDGGSGIIKAAFDGGFENYGIIMTANSSASAEDNGSLNGTLIEIRVYN